jgi:hypothetical protein
MNEYTRHELLDEEWSVVLRDPRLAGKSLMRSGSYLVVRDAGSIYWVIGSAAPGGIGHTVLSPWPERELPDDERVRDWLRLQDWLQTPMGPLDQWLNETQEVVA